MKKIVSLIAMCGVMGLAGCNKVSEQGDTVIIDFAGFMGEEQFQGGTGFNYALKLGSGQFVSGFEEQLVGAKIGEQRDVKITFPQDYYPQLAGKDVVFKVTIKDIKKK